MRPHTMLRIALIIMLSSIARPAWLHACTCVSVSACAAYRGTSVVLIGAAISKELYVDRAVYRVDVHSALKGATADTIEIATSPHGGGCGAEFALGVDYLLFVDCVDGVYTTSLCHLNTELAMSHGHIAIIDQIRRSTQHGSIVIGVANACTEEAIAGVAIHLQTIDSTGVDQYTDATDEDGNSVIVGIEPGTYRVWHDLVDGMVTDRHVDTVTITRNGCASSGFTLLCATTSAKRRPLRELDIPFAVLMADGSPVPERTVVQVKTLFTEPIVELSRSAGGRFVYNTYESVCFEARVVVSDTRGRQTASEWTSVSSDDGSQEIQLYIR